MSYREITSIRNPLVKDYMRLASSKKYRSQKGEMALEGPHQFIEALNVGLKPRTVFSTPSYLASKGKAVLSGLPAETGILLLSDTLFSRMVETKTPQAVAGIFPFHELSAEELIRQKITLALLMDRLQDPGNMGTILRTATAVGAETVFYTPGTVDPYSPKVLRSTAGAIFHLKLALAGDPLKLLEQLKEKGLQILAATPGTGKCFWEVNLARPSLLITGNENSGVCSSLVGSVDKKITIPQAGPVKSLNAAVATGVILYEAYRQRSFS